MMGKSSCHCYSSVVAVKAFVGRLWKGQELKEAFGAGAQISTGEDGDYCCSCCGYCDARSLPVAGEA